MVHESLGLEKILEPGVQLKMVHGSQAFDRTMLLRKKKYFQ